MRPKDAPWNMGAAMLIFTALCILMGIFPEIFYRFLPYPTDYVAYKPGKVLFYLQLLLFSGLAFFLLLPLMRRTLTISLDFDWLWRVFFFNAGSALVRGLSLLGGALESRVSALLTYLRDTARRHLGFDPDDRDHGIFARTWPIGTTALWIAVLLSVDVLAYFI